MKIQNIGNKTILQPEVNGYIVKIGSLILHRTMIVNSEESSLWRDAVQADIDAWNNRQV